jgi:15-cis-phytoene synthase
VSEPLRTAAASFPPPARVFKSSSFAPAFLFLPGPARRALAAVYAYCRAVDDAVDAGDPREARRVLAAWKNFLNDPSLETADPRASESVRPVLRQALDRFPIRRKHLLDLACGVEADLDRSRYETFEELKAYCHGVASTVGLACLPIFGLDEAGHASFAVNLGYAVQLTNILRDAGADARAGRIYIPQEDFKRFHYTEEDLRGAVRSAAFLRLMRFQAARARDFYALALAELPSASRRRARPALIMAGLYRALLEDLERRDFPVFNENKLRLSFWTKTKCVAKVFWNEFPQ